MKQKQKGDIDYAFLAMALGLILLGIFVLISAGGPEGTRSFGDPYYFVKHQVLFGLVPGIAAIVFFSRLSYQWWRDRAWSLLLLSVGLLLVVFIPGIAAEFGTSRSWITIAGAFSIQPAEIVKLTFLFYLAAWMAERGVRGVKDISSGLVPFVSVLGAIMFLMILQPDIGTMSIIVVMALAVYFVAGASWHHLALLFSGGLSLFLILVLTAPYRLARFTAFLHPDQDPLGTGYHVNQALIAIGSGGIFGRGYGHSLQKFQYLPEVVSDSIFAVGAEELGVLFGVMLLVLFGLFFRRGIKIALATQDAFGRYIVIGVISWITFQAIVNIGSIMSVWPMTGVPLPFVSYGGTALAVTMGAVGVVLNISRQAKIS